MLTWATNSANPLLTLFLSTPGGAGCCRVQSFSGATWVTCIMELFRGATWDQCSVASKICLSATWAQPCFTACRSFESTCIILRAVWLPISGLRCCILAVSSGLTANGIIPLLPASPLKTDELRASKRLSLREGVVASVARGVARCECEAFTGRIWEPHPEANTATSCGSAFSCVAIALGLGGAPAWARFCCRSLRRRS